MATKDPAVVASLIDAAFTGRSIMMSGGFSDSPLTAMGDWGAMVNSVAIVNPAAGAIASTVAAPMILASAIHKFSNGTADINTYADIAGLVAARTGHPALAAMAISFSLGVKIGTYIDERWGDEISDAVAEAAISMTAVVDSLQNYYYNPGLGDVFRDLSTKIAAAAGFPKDSPHQPELRAWIESQKQTDSLFQKVDVAGGYSPDQVFGPVAEYSKEMNVLTKDLWSGFRYNNPFGFSPIDTSAFGSGFIPGPAGPPPAARIDTPWIMFNGNKICLEVGPRDPLVLDLSGNGIQLSSFSSGSTYFEMNNNSARLEKTGWVAPGEGLVVVDLNDNGKIDGIHELMSEYFGVSPSAGDTLSRKSFSNGFEALKSLDSNDNNVFDSEDASWQLVKVWSDENQDGVSWKDTNGNGKFEVGEVTELASLDDLNIEKIGLLKVQAFEDYRNGNKVIASGSFVQAGESKEAIAVGFVTDDPGFGQSFSLDSQLETLISMMAASPPAALGAGVGLIDGRYRLEPIFVANA